MPSLADRFRFLLNGTAPAPPETPAQQRAREATERRLEATAQFENMLASQAHRLSENFIGLLGSPLDNTLYGPGPGGTPNGGGPGYGGGRQTYDKGRDATAYVTDAELLVYREQSRVLYRWNDYAGNVIDRLAEYTAGKGYTWTVRQRKKKQRAAGIEDDAPPDVQSAQEAIDDFRDRDKWKTRGQENVRRFHRDGDCIVRIFRGAYGKLPRVRYVEPEHVLTPPGFAGRDEWSFGVLTEPGDAESRLAVFVAPNGLMDRGVVVPFEGADPHRVRELSPGLKIGAGVVLMLAANVDRTVKRGLPSLLASREGMEKARKLLRNILDTSAFQAAIGLIRQHAQGTQASVTDFQQRMTGGATVPIPGIAAGGVGGPTFRTVPAMTQAGGTNVVDSTDATTYNPGPVSTGTPSFLAAQQAQLRTSGVREAMPEYMVSGDASNANFASTKESGTPWVVARESDQDLFADFERDIARVVLRMACESSAAQADPAALDVDVTPPGVAMQSDLEKEQVNDIRLKNKTASPQEVIRQRGGDPAHTIADLTSWEEQFPDPAGQLPGLDGFDDKPPKDKKPPAKEQP